MNKFLKAFSNSVSAFSKDEEGAQIVEYALIVAVVSIALVLVLKTLTTGGGFSAFISRVSVCLTGTTTCA